MWSRIINDRFNTWKLPRAFSTRDALNKTCSLLLLFGPSHLSCFHSTLPLSLTPTSMLLHTYISIVYIYVYSMYTRARTYIRTVYLPILFSFPFLFLSLGHASTPFLHPRFSFKLCGERVSLSSFLSLRRYNFFLFDLSIASSCPIWVCFLLFRMYFFQGIFYSLVRYHVGKTPNRISNN